MKFLFVLAAFAASATAHSQDLPDRWIPYEDVDKFDGGKTTGAVAPSRSTGYFPQRRPAEMDKVANLRVVCAKGKTVVYIELHDQLIAGSGISVSYRFDDRTPVAAQQWQTSSDSTAAGFWGGPKAVAFAKAIEKSKSLLVRTEHNVFGRMEAEFETSNAQKHFAPIRAACKWK